MHAVRIRVETDSASIEYLVHVRNHSRHALHGARRAGWRRYPKARSVIAEFTEHRCSACSTSSAQTAVRSVFGRTPIRGTT